MKKNQNQNEPNFRRTLINDIKQGGFKRTIRQDLNEITRFYLDNRTLKRLESMGRIRRWFAKWFWIIKSLILKLTPVRRVLLVFSLILTFGQSRVVLAGGTLSMDFRPFSYLIVLFILMLELKDKLLARDELAVGRAVQSALLPRDHPSWPGWDIWMVTRPANEVGGDLVDYLETEDSLYLFLGDVAGKGLGAALLMSKLQATLRAVTPGERSLGALGVKMNHIFRRDGLPSRFVSLITLAIGRRESRIRFLNAGHMPPLLLRSGRVRELPSGHAALGILADAEYEEKNLNLQKGDWILIYSDGLTEARDDAGEFFGEERLFSFLKDSGFQSACEMGNAILETIGDFIGSNRPSDDLSMIILHYTGSP